MEKTWIDSVPACYWFAYLNLHGNNIMRSEKNKMFTWPFMSTKWNGYESKISKRWKHVNSLSMFGRKLFVFSFSLDM